MNEENKVFQCQHFVCNECRKTVKKDCKKCREIYNRNYEYFNLIKDSIHHVPTHFPSEVYYVEGDPDIPVLVFT